MSDFEIKQTIKKEAVPQPRTGRRDYSKLIKSVATLEKGEALELDVAKKHIVTGIKNILEKEFKHTRFTVTQRSNKEDETLTVYIIREN